MAVLDTNVVAVVACYGSFERFPRVSGASCSKPRAPKPRYVAPQTNTTFGSTSVGSSYSPYLI
jgi:hypothetical protein